MGQSNPLQRVFTRRAPAIGQFPGTRFSGLARRADRPGVYAGDQIAEWIGALKGASAHHLNHNVMARPIFAWQAGYGVVTFGQKDLPFVEEYVRNQRARHAEGRLYHRLEQIEAEQVAEAAVREGR